MQIFDEQLSELFVLVLHFRTTTGPRNRHTYMADEEVREDNSR